MDMLNLAEQWGWVGSGTGADLEKVLRLMLDESDPRLPAGYIKLDEVLLTNYPFVRGNDYSMLQIFSRLIDY